MAAYFIARVSIQDRDAYQAYEQGFMAILDEHGGQLVSVDEQPLVLEGDWACTRTVLLRFETAEAGKAWYHSDAYQTLAQVRFQSATSNIVMVQGFV